MKKIRVLHIRDSCGIYGAERVILALAKHMDSSKFRMALLGFNDKEGEGRKLSSKMAREGLDVLAIPIKGKVDVAALWKMRGAIRSLGVDVIHSHDYKSNMYGVLASLGMKVGRVVTAHGATKESFKKRMYLSMDDRLVYRFFDKIVAVSQDLGERLIEIHRDFRKVCVIKNGIDLSCFVDRRRTPSEKKEYLGRSYESVFGVIGRLTEEKGHKYFLEAFLNVSKRHASVGALIVGDGPLRSDLEVLVSRLGLEKKVVFCGFVDDMPGLYRKLDCVVIPSLREGLPYTLLEGLGAGLPVIGTRVGEIPRVITDGKTGYLTTPGCSSEIERSMLALLEDRIKAVEIGRNGLELVEKHYSAVQMTRQYEVVYEDVAGRRCGSLGGRSRL